MGPPGHFAIALAAKPLAPKVPLWVLLIASEVLDLLAFAFFAIKIERAAPNPWFPWSHGLAMSVVWSLLFGLVAYLVFRDRRAGLAVGAVVFSHWILDFISHSRDLPLLFGPPLVGLGLERSLAVGLIMELTMLAVGLVIYLRHRRSLPSRHATS